MSTPSPAELARSALASGESVTNVVLDRYGRPDAPAGVFDLLNFDSEAIHGLAVVAGPGETLGSDPREGDLLLSRTRGEWDSGRLGVVTSSGLVDWSEARARGGPIRDAGPGLYAEVISDARPNGNAAVRVADATGRLPVDQMLVRPQMSVADVEPRPDQTPVDWELERWPDLVHGAGPESPGAQPVAAGRAVIDDAPVLRRHVGAGPDLILRWNAMPIGTSSVDVVVHFHGYSPCGADMRVDRDKEPTCGLDFANPLNPIDPRGGRQQPTVCVLPRGNYFGGRTGAGFDHPALITDTGLRQLIAFALERFAGITGVLVFAGRLILTAHAGGGAGLIGALRHNNPDEIHIFDALYGPADDLVRWARIRIVNELSGGALGALRVLYVPDGPTAQHSLELRRALEDPPLGSPPAGQAGRFNVEPTTASPALLPQLFGWRLLADAAGAPTLGESPAAGPEVESESVSGQCNPGEGPPRPEPGPDGTGRPVIDRGTSAARSRRPAVGYAQMCLSQFLARYQAGTYACAEPSAASRAFARSAIATLRANRQLPLVVDCRFGHNTELATKAFQVCAGLTPDGKIGSRTWRALETLAPPVDDDSAARWRRILGPAARDGNDVLELIDGPDTFRSMLAAIRTATGSGHYIYLLGWWLDIDEPLDVPLPPAPQCPPPPRGGPSTIRALFSKASADGVQVRVVLWDQLGTKNSAEVRFVNGLASGAAVLDNHQIGPTLGAHHQKLLVVKGTEGLIGFCGGIDVNCDRVCEAGTCAAGGSGGSASGSSPGQPHHDVHCRIAGPAARDVLEVFIKRWLSTMEHARLDAAKGPLLGRSEPVPSSAGPAVVRIGETFNATATLSPGISRTFRDRTVQEILLAVIAAARRFIYIEEQYMIGMCAAEAIRRALPNVDHVTILACPSELLAGLNLPRRWELRKRFIDHIRSGPDGHKLRVFVPSIPGREGSAAFGPHTYVHAKILVADDELAVIGSPNINRRGWEYDSEVVAAITGPGRDGAPLARTLRTRLWAEHLDVPPAAVADPILSKGLWLTARTRRVRPYDPLGGTDPGRETHIPEDVIDPPLLLATAPCCAIHGPSCPSVMRVPRSTPAPAPILAGVP